MSTKLSPEVIAAAIDGFESQKRRIDTQIRELRVMLNGKHPASAAPESAKRKRRKISAAGRKRMAAAQRRRWATTKHQPAPSLQAVMAEAPKRKRRLSAAGRKRIIEATKRRWALKRAEAAKAQRLATRKGTSKNAAANRAAA